MKVAVITGASAGIGLCTADLFVKSGYKVYNLSRKPSAAAGVVSITTDVSSRENVFESVKKITRDEGRIDVLVNCAGFGISGAIEDTGADAVKKLFDVNFFGTLYAVQAVIPVMRQNKGGTINQYEFGGRAVVAALSGLLFGHKVGGVKPVRSIAHRGQAL